MGTQSCCSKKQEEENKSKREADLDRHLDRDPGNVSDVFNSEVSAADDYMMYQALILLKGASVLAPDNKY